jgi:exopolyphosphatase/guanosine-5'-triphosphate,3'-diphosphate pyrophosphatase
MVPEHDYVHPVTMKFDSLAAVDLGSNSFHLQIGRVVDEQIYLLDSLREPVRLGAGLTRDKRIDRTSQLRALEALARFSERLRGFPKGAVRAVGTNALRVAKNAPQFLVEAEATLGFPIEVIFGREEARLIYLGVAHSLAPSGERRLVVDIGGGSTECIIGTGFEPQLMESLHVGCVSASLKYFPEGRIDKQGFKQAELAARSEVQTIAESYRELGWTEAIGSSGTAKSIATTLQTSGWTEAGITLEGLDRLRAALIKAGDSGRLDVPGLRADRAEVLPGGCAIMAAVFAEFGIEKMAVSDGALRQGVLYDLVGRFQRKDMREVTVGQFMRRYHVDAAQAERVGKLALKLHGALAGGKAPEEDAALLTWAAALHEIGISIAHTGYHKHSAYMLSNADMPGFSQMEQARLAHVVLAHRGKLSKLEALPLRSADWGLIFCLRMAVLFHRSRSKLALPAVGCKASDGGFQLSLPQGWLDEHPLTAAALDGETDEWRGIGLKLDVREVAEEKLRAAG